MWDAVESGIMAPRRVIVACRGAVFGERIARDLPRWSWQVEQTHSGPQARRLAHWLCADVVILEAELPEESGWLTCAKLTRELPLVKVILLGEDATAENQRFASFVGAAAFLGRRESFTALYAEVTGTSGGLRGWPATPLLARMRRQRAPHAT